MTAPREHHLGYAVVEVGDDGDVISVLLPTDDDDHKYKHWRPQIRLEREKALADLDIAKKRWPGNKLRVARVSAFLSGPRAPR